MAPKRERRCPATLIIREMQMKAKLGSTVTCQSGRAEQASERARASVMLCASEGRGKGWGTLWRTGSQSLH